jgi:hypothetical protein
MGLFNIEIEVSAHGLLALLFSLAFIALILGGIIGSPVIFLTSVSFLLLALILTLLRLYLDYSE